MKERIKIIEEVRKLNDISKQVKHDLMTYSNEVFWEHISAYRLNEKFIRENRDCVNWDCISIRQQLSEDFIREFSDYVEWSYISANQKLSENFIEECKDNVNWNCISSNQRLSEDFIRKFQDCVNWNNISTHQCLKEDFICEFKDLINWKYISAHQKLSEDFIKEFKDSVDWYYISRCQQLSEFFIMDMINYANWKEVINHQQFHKTYRRKFKIHTNKDNWLYKGTKFKKEQVINTGMYECHEDYFIAYKGIRSDRYSNFNFQYQYLPNKTYTCHADYTNEDNSFGLSARTENKATWPYNDLVIKVKVYYKDVARVVCNGGSIRCSKLIVLN